MKMCETFEVKIYIAGDLSRIKDICQRYCATGFCVSVTPTTYVYTGGREEGAIIGLISYARFPESSSKIVDRAHDLAEMLLNKLGQRSCSIVMPDDTVYLSNKTIKVPREGT
jgi:hypothetical protein